MKRVKTGVMPLVILPKTNVFNYKGRTTEVIATMTVCPGKRATYTFDWVRRPLPNIKAVLEFQIYLLEVNEIGEVVYQCPEPTHKIGAYSHGSVYPPHYILRGWNLDGVNDYKAPGSILESVI